MTFLLCDPDWYAHNPDVQNERDGNTHIYTYYTTKSINFNSIVLLVYTLMRRSTLYYTLYYTILYTILYYTVLYYAILYTILYTILYCTILWLVSTHCVLQFLHNSEQVKELLMATDDHGRMPLSMAARSGDKVSFEAFLVELRKELDEDEV